jgi:selenocysteine-specific elongation factor
MGHVIIGTAGHIDHGKSLLVKALTGTDPDRLPEEQQRQITIDLGFAFLDDVAAIIDVPGHERFVHNMVAGAATIDYAMLVVAADDGVMPQTQEHLDILRLLGLERGVVVITKSDLIEQDWLDLVRDQIRELVAHTFLENAPVFVVDSASGRGISELRGFLLKELPELQRKGDRGYFRLPVDRAFQVKGYGTVVTGTVLSGRVAVEDRLELLPKGEEVRVRGLQTHGAPQTSLGMGQRAAINLSGVDRGLIQRGDFLATPGHMAACKSWRAKVALLPNVAALKNRQRVRVHIGTQEVMARVLLLVDDGSLSDFYFESQVVASRLDRFVLRSYSPMVTIGGGFVAELNPPRVTKSNRSNEVESSITLSQASERDFIRLYLEKRMPFGATLAELIQIVGFGNEIVVPLLADLMAHSEILLQGERYLSTSSLNHHCQAILETLREFHKRNPELVGMERAELRQTALPGMPETLLTAILKGLLDENKIKAHGSVLSLSEHTAAFSESHEMLAERLLSLIQAANFRPPPIADMAKATETSPNEVVRVLALLVKRKQLVRLEPELFFHPNVFRNAISRLRHEIAAHGSVSVGNISTVLDSSRKYVVPFLEHMDKLGVTKREGDQRVAGPQFREEDAQTGLATPE